MNSAGMSIQTSSLFMDSWFYNLYAIFLLSLIVVGLPYFGLICVFYEGNLRKLFRINKTNLLWFLGFLLAECLFFGVFVFIKSIFNDINFIADQIQDREPNMNWIRYLPVGIMLLGASGFFISLSNFFRANITTIKKTILFIICLLPVVVAVYFSQKNTVINTWLVVRFCVKCSLFLWISSSIVILKKKALFKPKISRYLFGKRL